jgi:hypothetical protein
LVFVVVVVVVDSGVYFGDGRTHLWRGYTAGKIELWGCFFCLMTSFLKFNSIALTMLGDLFALWISHWRISIAGCMVSHHFIEVYIR